LSKSNRNRK